MKPFGGRRVEFVGQLLEPVGGLLDVVVGVSHGDPVKSSSTALACHGVARCDTVGQLTDHYTLRLAQGMRERVSEQARRAGPPERTLAQRYLEEGLRHDAHPLVQFLDGPSGRRASLVGRGLDVWEVIATVRDNAGSPTEAADNLQVPAGLVEAAVSYYGDYRAEIDDEIVRNDAEYERGAR